MSFLLPNKKGGNIPANATFRITQQGIDKVAEYNGDAKSRILMALDTQGTLNIVELSQRSRLNRGKTERLLPSLLQGGYITLASSHSGVEE